MSKRIGTILILAAVWSLPAFAIGQETCPQDGGWTKIDSSDLSLYPVPGATEYCFKAGSGNSEGCTGGLFDSWPQPEGTCGLSHWSYFIPEEDPTPTNTPTDKPTPTPTNTPTDVPTPTPTDDPRCQEECEDPTPTPTETPPDNPTPTPTDPPSTPELPKAGFTSQYEILNGEPWQLSVPGNVWAAHNQEGWIASTWWMLWEGKEFIFNGQWYTTERYVIADPTEVELIGQAVDYDLLLITCRNYDPVTNRWAERLLIFAELSQ